jgi:hypothetical protein
MCARHVARVGEKRGAYRVLVGKPDGRGPLGRSRHTSGDDILINLQEI